MIQEIQVDTKAAYTVMKESTQNVTIGMDVVAEAGQNFSKILEDIFRIQQDLKIYQRGIYRKNIVCYIMR